MRFPRVWEPASAATNPPGRGESPRKLAPTVVEVPPGRAAIAAIVDEKIHKEPRHALLYGWYEHPRYTFVDDEIVPLYESERND